MEIRLPENEILYFLNRLNRDMEEFLKNSLEHGSEGKEWSTLHNDFRLLRCREVKQCDKEKCPAYRSKDYRCWLVTGTLCADEPLGDYSKKYQTCSACPVFQKVAKDPLLALYENISILIYHLQQRASRFRDLAIRDQLTGLYNRHFFNEIIGREIVSLGRRPEVLSFAIVDIDCFKEINDTLGHLMGDEILVETAALIKSAVRKSDVVFRFGGDEFLVMMSTADTAVRNTVDEQIGSAVAAWNRKNAQKYGVELSLSIGCATCGKDGDYLAALKEADKRMYLNKVTKKGKMRAPGLPDIQSDIRTANQ
ncbi:MAG: GGDEF domain-containing protein [Nitrospirota bacterium]